MRWLNKNTLTYIMAMFIFVAMLSGCVHDFSGAAVVLRHGQSEANVAGIIASSPEIALHNYGLTKEGRKQVRKSAREIKRCFPAREFVIVASPLLRTQQTAEETAKILGVAKNDIITDERLTERDFSFFDGQSDAHYNDVWVYDEQGHTVSSHFNGKVEELASVRDRTQQAIRDYKEKYPDKIIIFVGHGDVASNIIALDKGAPLKDHRKVGGLPTAGWYELKRK